MRKLFTLLSFLIAALSWGVHAEEPQQASVQSLDEDEFYWQLSLGLYGVKTQLPELVGADSTYSGATVLVDAIVEYKNFYLRARSGDFFGGADVGYQLWQSGDTGIDLIVGSYELPFSEKGYDSDGAVVPELAGIKEREQDSSLGVAYYRNFNDYQVIVELVYDALGESRGWVLHAESTRTFELRNWDVWLNFGLNYYSGNFIDYYYGVDSDEQTAFRPMYELSGGASVFTQLQANYPISQSWVFSGGASLLVGSTNVKNSPLVESQHASVIFAGVKYVF